MKLYQTHWWRCNGPCQSLRPHFGIVRRSANRAPGPTDCWWQSHKNKCGGTFIKIKEPEKKQKAKAKKEVDKSNQDITKYITNYNNVPINKPGKPVLKDANSDINKPTLKGRKNNASTIVVSKKGAVFNPTVPKPFSKPSQPIIPSVIRSGNTIGTASNTSKSSDVVNTVRNVWATKQIHGVPSAPPNKDLETVRNIWAKKQIPSINTGPVIKAESSPTTNKPLKKLGINSPSAGASNPKKHKTDASDVKSPPTKMKKISDYFNATTILKDLYGDDYELTKAENTSKLIAVKVQIVDCPICNSKFNSDEINRHIDECLNKDVIEQLCNDSSENVQDIKSTQSIVIESNVRLIGDLAKMPAFKGNPNKINNNIDLTNLNDENSDNIKNEKIESRKSEPPQSWTSENKNLIEALVDKIDDQNRKQSSNRDNKPLKRRNTVSFIIESRGDSLLHINKREDETTPIDEIKSEPGTSGEAEVFGQTCPCCGKKFDKPVEQHLDECLVFFDNNDIISEGPSTSYSNNTTIVIDDDDDIFDESQILNATGTKTPCPCCMEMVELVDMNEHLDTCLQ